MRESLKQFLEGTPLAKKKLLAIWDTLDDLTLIQLLDALFKQKREEIKNFDDEYKNIRYESYELTGKWEKSEVDKPDYDVLLRENLEKIILKAFEHNNFYIRYLSAKIFYKFCFLHIDEKDDKFSNQFIKIVYEKIVQDSDNLVRAIAKCIDMSKEESELKDFLNFDQETRLEIIKAVGINDEVHNGVMGVRFVSAFNEIIKMALANKVNDHEIYEWVWESNRNDAIEYKWADELKELWSLIPNLPSKTACYLAKYFPLKGASRDFAVFTDYYNYNNYDREFEALSLEDIRKILSVENTSSGILLKRRDFDFQEIRKEIFFDHSKNDFMRINAATYLCFSDEEFLKIFNESTAVDDIKILYRSESLTLSQYEYLYDFLQKKINDSNAPYQNMEIYKERHIKNVDDKILKEEIRDLCIYEFSKRLLEDQDDIVSIGGNNTLSCTLCNMEDEIVAKVKRERGWEYDNEKEFNAILEEEMALIANKLEKIAKSIVRDNPWQNYLNVKSLLKERNTDIISRYVYKTFDGGENYLIEERIELKNNKISQIVDGIHNLSENRLKALQVETTHEKKIKMSRIVNQIKWLVIFYTIIFGAVFILSKFFTYITGFFA